MSDAEQIRERLLRLRRVVATTRTPSGMTLLLPFDAEWLIEQAEKLEEAEASRKLAWGSVNDMQEQLGAANAARAAEAVKIAQLERELARLRDEQAHATIDDLPTTLETP